MSDNYIDIVFHAPPGPTAPEFIEVEDADGVSIQFGQWVQRPNTTWAIRFTQQDIINALTDLKDRRRDKDRQRQLADRKAGRS